MIGVMVTAFCVGACGEVVARRSCSRAFEKTGRVGFLWADYLVFFAASIAACVGLLLVAVSPEAASGWLGAAGPALACFGVGFLGSFYAQAIARRFGGERARKG